MTTYKVLVGIDYGNKRAEIGDTVSDLPTKSVSWLLEQNCIEVVGESVPTKKNKPEVEIQTKEIE